MKVALTHPQPTPHPPIVCRIVSYRVFGWLLFMSARREALLSCFQRVSSFCTVRTRVRMRLAKTPRVAATAGSNCTRVVDSHTEGRFARKGWCDNVVRRDDTGNRF